MAKSAKELLAELQVNLPKVKQTLPHVHEAFGGHLAPDILKDGTLSRKHKELMALAIAVRITCDYSVVYHAKRCLEAGATQEEIAEACSVAIMMGGGPSVAYSGLALEAVEELSP
jgi:AhpD family alkylhydroperoxidase